MCLQLRRYTRTEQAGNIWDYKSNVIQQVKDSKGGNGCISTGFGYLSHGTYNPICVHCRRKLLTYCTCRGRVRVS